MAYRSARSAFDAAKRNEFKRNTASIILVNDRVVEPPMSPSDAASPETEITTPRGVMTRLPEPMSAADAAA